jgi:hypothetical protein
MGGRSTYKIVVGGIPLECYSLLLCINRVQGREEKELECRVGEGEEVRSTLAGEQF